MVTLLVAFGNLALLKQNTLNNVWAPIGEVGGREGEKYKDIHDI